MMLQPLKSLDSLIDSVVRAPDASRIAQVDPRFLSESHIGRYKLLGKGFLLLEVIFQSAEYTDYLDS